MNLWTSYSIRTKRGVLANTSWVNENDWTNRGDPFQPHVSKKKREGRSIVPRQRVAPDPDGNEAEGAAVLFSSLPAQQQDQTGKQARLGAHVPSDDNHTFSS
jgi:hypothetical protein